MMAEKSMLQRNLIKHLLDSLLRPFVLGLTFIGNKQVQMQTAFYTVEIKKLNEMKQESLEWSL